jgi:AsmA family protein
VVTLRRSVAAPVGVAAGLPDAGRTVTRLHLWPLRARHWTALVLAGLLLAGVAVVAIGEQHLKTPLLRVLAARTGREFRVGGNFGVHLLSRHPRIIAEQVAVQNPPWMPAGVTAEAARVSLLLEWQLAIVPLAIRHLELEGAQLHLVRDASGRANWMRYEDGPGRGPPLIRGLHIPDAGVELHDELRHLQFTGVLNAQDADTQAAAPPLLIEAHGDLNGRAATLRLTGDPLAQASRGRPYHYAVTAVSGATKLSAEGTVDQPFDFRSQHWALEASGPDLKDLHYLLGLKLPDTAPFRLATNLALQKRRLHFSDLAAHFGESEVHGTLTVGRVNGQEEIEGDLRSQRLRLADLGARAAGRAPAQEATAPARYLPDTPLQLATLLHTEARVKFSADELDVGPEVLQGLSGRVVIDHGVLKIEGVRASLAQGNLSGDARLDATGKEPSGELTVNATDVQLGELKTKAGSASPVAGLLSARLQLQGNGNSPHQLAATASGTVAAVITGGELRAALAEAASLDLTGLLGAKVDHNRDTAIRCGVAKLDASAGVLTVQTALLDTDAAVIHGSGTLQVDGETLDLKLRGQPKHPGLALHSAVNIRGDLAHPQMRLDAGHLAAQGAAAVALGLVLTPVAAVLAFVNPGLAHDVDCQSLLMAADPAPPQPPSAQANH